MSDICSHIVEVLDGKVLQVVALRRVVPSRVIGTSDQLYRFENNFHLFHSQDSLEAAI